MKALHQIEGATVVMPAAPCFYWPKLARIFFTAPPTARPFVHGKPLASISRTTSSVG
jgi:hypothetical protein